MCRMPVAALWAMKWTQRRNLTSYLSPFLSVRNNEMIPQNHFIDNTFMQFLINRAAEAAEDRGRINNDNTMLQAKIDLRTQRMSLPTVRLRPSPTAAHQAAQLYLPPAAQGCLGQTLTCGSRLTGHRHKNMGYPNGVSHVYVQALN